jgi:uncharacterized protein with PIN domain
MMKRCSKCKVLLELTSDNFHRDKYQQDGFTNVCKKCRQILKKNYDDNHHEKILLKLASDIIKI